MVTRLDRLARSTRDLANTLAAITERKAGFRSSAIEIRQLRQRTMMNASSPTPLAVSVAKHRFSRLY
jgi:DNA invertase Pin-like site-specific DNA recombinase